MTLKFILIGRRLYNSTQIIAIPPIMPDLDSDITIAKINSKANNCITNIQNLEEIDFIHNNIKGKPIHRLTAKPAGLSKLPVIPYLLSKRTNCNHRYPMQTFPVGQ